MRRRLTAKEIKDYNSTKCQDGETTLQFIKNLENMNQVWDKEIGNSLYLKSMKEFVDDDDFDLLVSAQSKNKLGPEAQQAVFVRDDQPLHLLPKNHFQQLVQARLAVVHAAA